MNDEIKLSVIVPMYNSEKYVEKCITSITSQTYHNIEIIVVDDGSKDKSSEIVHKMKQNDNRIRMIKKMNGGVSSARNIGIKEASGQYITFVDSDDYLDTNTYKKILESMNCKNCKNAIFAYETLYIENKKSEAILLPWKDGTILENKDIRNELIPALIAGKKGEKRIKGAVWRTIFSREIAKSNSFEEEIKIQEDLIYCLKTYMQMDKILIINDAKYKYLKHENSTTECYRNSYYKESLNFEDKIIQTLKENSIFNNIGSLYFTKRVGMYSLSVSNLFRYNSPQNITNELEEIIEGFQNDRYIKDYFSFNLLNNKMRLFYIFMKIRAKKIICIIYKYKETKRHKNLKHYLGE